MVQARRALLLAQKDLRLFVRDRGALLFALAFPLVFVFGFSRMAGGGAPDDPIAVVLATEEGGESLSQQIITGMVRDPAAHARQLPPAEAGAQVEDGTLGGFILFPQGFGDAVRAGRGAQIRVVADPDAESTARARLDGVARTLATELGNRQLAAQAALALLPQAATAPDQQGLNRAVQALVTAGGPAGAPAVGIRTEQVGDVEAQAAGNRVLPGYLTMFIFFVAGLAAEAFIKERDNHTLDRLLASGVGAGALLAGKWLGTAARSVLQAAVLWLVGVLYFGVDLGRAPLGAVLVTLAMIVASASFALFLAAIARTVRSADTLVVLSALILAAVGGSWWPLFVMPPWMQALARVTPHAWANDAFNRLLLFGAATGDILLNVLVLLGFAAVFAAAGVARARVRA